MSIKQKRICRQQPPEFQQSHNHWTPWLMAAGLCGLVFSFAVKPEQFDEETQLTQVERIKVTANRRETLLQDLSASLVVIDGQELEERGINALAGIGFAATSVSLHQPLRNRATFSIRGINTDIGETQLTQEPTALYINDMLATGPYAAVFQPDINLYDIDRVEVLRGPQGTLFGSGTLAGAVRILTRSAELNNWQASTRLDVANGTNSDTRARVDAMLNLPLIEDKLALRLVSSTTDDDGFVYNPALDLTNRTNDQTLRANITAQLVPNLTLNLDWLNHSSTPEDADSWSPTLGRFLRQSTIDEGRDGELDIINLTLDCQLNEHLRFTSSTNFRHTRAIWRTDFGPIPGIGSLVNTSGPFVEKNWVQEFRVHGQWQQLDWVFGFFAQDSDTDANAQLDLIGLRDFVEQILGPQADLSDRFLLSKIGSGYQEQAAFTDLQITLSDDWQLALGARYVNTDSRYQDTNIVQFDFASLSLIQAPAFANQQADNDWLWRVVGTYKPLTSIHLYGSVSKGFRAGQINPNRGPSFVDPNDIVIQPGYQSDQTINYEVGTKLAWPDHGLQAQLTAFYIDWRDIQVDALRPSDRLNYIANAGDAQIKGIEFSLQSQLSTDWYVEVALSRQQAEIRELTAEQAFFSGARVGDDLPGAADWQATALIEHRFPVTAKYQLASQLFTHFQDSSTNRFSFASGSDQPNPDLGTNASYLNLDAAVSLIDKSWRLSLYAENLTNNDNIILNLGQTLANPFVSLRPRTIGIRFHYAWQ